MPMMTITRSKIVLLCLFAASPLLSMRLAPNDYEGGRLKNEVDREVRNSSAFATILGELRTNMSDLMFMKTERYLHGGVAYMPHLNVDKLAQTGEISDQNATAGNAPGSTVIPEKGKDFRGYVGYLHRQVKPWQDPNAPHTHTSGEELLPWYRLMTLTDPNNRRAYLIGTWWLKDKNTDLHDAEGLKFINEGIRNNPRGFDLYLTRGYLQRQMEDDTGARQSFQKAAELAIEVRPVELLQEGGEESAAAANWTSYNEEDARAAVRLAVFTERDHGSREEALKMAIRYNEAIGGDGRLQAMIEALSSPPEEEGGG